MNYTKEDYKLAAKACGYEIKLIRAECRGRIEFLISDTRNLGEFSKWNPAENDSDCFKAIVDSGITVAMKDRDIKNKVNTYDSGAYSEGRAISASWVEYGNNKYNATRKAVMDTLIAIGNGIDQIRATPNTGHSNESD